MPGPSPYRQGFGRTPAPVFDVAISWQGQRRVLEALVDSGASGTIVPESLALDLNLRKIGERTISGYDHRPERRSQYAVDIDFLGLLLRNFPVVAVPNRTYALIGRDILNRYVTTLDGPRL